MSVLGIKFRKYSEVRMYLYVQENHYSQNIIREGKVGATLHSRITLVTEGGQKGNQGD